MNNKNNIKEKINTYNRLILVLVITFAIISAVLLIRLVVDNVNDNKSKNLLELIGKIQETDIDIEDINLDSIYAKECEVIGSIKIDSLDIEYPIIGTTTEETLNIGITKLAGPKLNEYGNVCLAGHNNRNGKLFSKIININKGDIVKITDIKGNSVSYSVYDIYVVSPDDISCIEENDKSKKEITLITCTMNNQKRFIVKAEEVK